MKLFLTTDVFAKTLLKITAQQNKVNLYDLLLFRGISHFIFGSTLVTINGKNPLKDLPVEFRWNLFFVVACGTYGNLIMFFSIKYLPVFLVLVILNTAPFHASLIGYCINQEKITKQLIGFMFGCFVGIIIFGLAKSGIIGEEQKQATSMVVTDKEYNVGILLMVVTVYLYVFQQVLTRKLQTVHVSILVFYYGLLQFISFVLYNLIEYAIFHNDQKSYPYKSIRVMTYSSRQYGYIIAWTIIDNLVTLFSMSAFQLEDTGFLTLVGQISTLYAFIVDITILDMKPELFQSLGTLIIFIFTILAIFFKNKANKEETDTIIIDQENDDVKTSNTGS